MLDCRPWITETACSTWLAAVAMAARSTADSPEGTRSPLFVDGPARIPGHPSSTATHRPRFTLSEYEPHPGHDRDPRYDRMRKRVTRWPAVSRSTGPR